LPNDPPRSTVEPKSRGYLGNVGSALPCLMLGWMLVGQWLGLAGASGGRPEFTRLGRERGGVGLEGALIPAVGSSDGRSAPHATAVWAGSICQELARPVLLLSDEYTRHIGSLCHCFRIGDTAVPCPGRCREISNGAAH
jgi:hypothetical protein